ncbi:MAG TPA: hypothetical protein VM051_09955 [Usitatibacter sp.]|nr:hypothetical protein [Usitatibacter sp.]
MRHILASAVLLLAFSLPAAAQEYVDIDVDVPEYPEMVPVPDSPVYYAPGVDSNYFFYDGLYWDYYNDRWYSSAWYNGPWTYVDPVYVPTYVLWVPIRYYRRAPHYWRGWSVHRPPRWAEHWGRDWQVRHNQNFRAGHRPAYARAPLPDYQRSYNRGNYPRALQQQNDLHTRNYGYRPQENVVRQHYEHRGMGAAQQAAPAPVPQRAPDNSREANNPGSRMENPAARGDSRGGDRGGRDRDRR